MRSEVIRVESLDNGVFPVDLRCGPSYLILELFLLEALSLYSSHSLRQVLVPQSARLTAARDRCSRTSGKSRAVGNAAQYSYEIRIRTRRRIGGSSRDSTRCRIWRRLGLYGFVR